MSATLVRAAEFRIVTDGQEALGTGTSFEAKVVIDTQEESINAFEGTVLFPSDLLTPLEVREDSSIVNFWIERPRTSTSTAMRFSGITPGGFTGQGPLFSVIFRTTKLGSGTIAVANPRALRDNGAGSPAHITSTGARVIISNTITSSGNVPPMGDIDPPEPFTPVIVHNPILFDDKYVLIFATQDKKSGIDHYEVCEGNRYQCIIAESPHLLQYQDLSRNIFVKAVDKTGNERIATLPVFMHLLWPQILLLFGILGVFLWWILVRSHKFLWQNHISSY